MLLQLYNELGKSGASDAQTFETIIEEKHQKEDLMCVGQSLYRDIKGWCRSYQQRLQLHCCSRCIILTFYLQLSGNNRY